MIEFLFRKRGGGWECNAGQPTFTPRLEALQCRVAPSARIGEEIPSITAPEEVRALVAPAAGVIPLGAQGGIISGGATTDSP